jgi:hypothetical protein
VKASPEAIEQLRRCLGECVRIEKSLPHARF